MANVIVHCRYTSESGEVRKFFEEVISSGLQKDIWAEDGCLQYDYAMSLQEEGVGLLLEMWRDEDALQKHIAGECMDRLKAIQSGYDVAVKGEKFALAD